MSNAEYLQKTKTNPIMSLTRLLLLCVRVLVKTNDFHPLERERENERESKQVTWLEFKSSQPDKPGLSVQSPLRQKPNFCLVV